MNGKEFTQHDMTIAEKLSTIMAQIDHLQATQESTLDKIKIFCDANSASHSEIWRELHKAGKKIHWMIGIGVGVAAVTGVLTFVSRVYGN